MCVAVCLQPTANSSCEETPLCPLLKESLLNWFTNSQPFPYNSKFKLPRCFLQIESHLSGFARWILKGYSSVSDHLRLCEMLTSWTHSPLGKFYLKQVCLCFRNIGLTLWARISDHPGSEGHGRWWATWRPVGTSLGSSCLVRRH